MLILHHLEKLEIFLQRRKEKNKKIGKNTKITNTKYLLGISLLRTCLLGTFIIS